LKEIHILNAMKQQQRQIRIVNLICLYHIVFLLSFYVHTNTNTNINILVAAAKHDKNTMPNEKVPTISIEGRLQYPNKLPYNNITTSIIVNHGEHNTYSRIDGTFTIHDIPPGVYIIDIYNPIHHFSQIKCQYKLIEEEEENGNDNKSMKKPNLSCLEYHYPGATKRTMDIDATATATTSPTSATYVLTVTALASYEYFEIKRGFNILSMLQNPMILMMIFTLGIMYLLPKMMENMDPEERAMMQKQMLQQQQNGNNPQQLMSQLFSGNFNALSDNNNDSSNTGTTTTNTGITSSSSSTSQNSNNNSNSKSKKSRK
jgi:ER membrane protein complex subunit 7